MTPDQILAFVLALTSPQPAAPAFPVIAAGGADGRYPVQAAPCPRPLAPFEIEGKTVACGTVSVPEDHAKPDGRRIPLTFMVFKSRSLAPAPDAVVHLHGGPGIGIVEQVALTSTYFEGLRTRRDVVAFDQRGVDTSAGRETRCLATLADHVTDLAGTVKPTDEPAHLPPALTRACLDELAASGADLSKINTEQNARDVQAVMRALGYPVYNVYGLSYVPKLVAELEQGVTTTFDAVVADQLPPRQTPETALTGLKGLDANSLAFAQTALRLARQGQIQADTVQTVLERLESDRAAVAAGTGLVDAYETALLAGARALPSPQARRAFASDYLRLRTGAPTSEALRGLDARHFAGETRQALDALVGLMTPRNLADTFTRISADNRKLDYMLVEGFQTEMFLCQEDMDINSPAGAAAMSARLHKEYLWPAAATKPIEAILNGLYATCDLFKKHYRPGFHDPVTADIPTLVFSGLLDTQTAASWGAETARHLPRSQAILFPETGHGALAFSQCARDLGVAFIENPGVPLDKSCVADLAPTFVLPEGPAAGQVGGTSK